MAEEKGALSSEVSYCHSSDFNVLCYSPVTVHKWPKSLFPELFPKYAVYSESRCPSRSSRTHSPLPPSSPEWPPLYYEASSPLPQEDHHGEVIDDDEWVSSLSVLFSIILQLCIRVPTANVRPSQLFSPECRSVYQEIEDLKIRLESAQEENKHLKKLLIKYGRKLIEVGENSSWAGEQE